MMLSALSEKLQKGEISSRELTEIYLEKEDNLGAFLYKNGDAIHDAEKIDKMRLKGEKLHPLAGIPIAIKDNIVTKNIPTTCASRTLVDYVPPYDATVVKKLKEAGLIILGKTNMDEFGMGSTGENSAFYPTKNPKDITKVAGGSSSGSAAAVAAGLAPVALGTDTGGSIRLPSAYCGTVGFKPSYGGVSRYGLIAFASSLDQIGVIANSVSDAELIFDIISGKDPLDMTSVDFENKVLSNPGFVRYEEIEDEMLNLLLPAYYIISSAEAYSNLNRYDGVYYGEDRKFGTEVQRRIELGEYVLSAENICEYYDKATAVRKAICRKMDKIFKNTDFIISGTYSGEIPKLGQVKNGSQMYSIDKYTVLANLAYLPAITLSDGTMIMGPRGSDKALLSFAKEACANGI